MDILPLVVDGIVILIFVACIFDGYRRGFVKMLLSIAAVSLSIVIAGAMSAPLAQWANDEYVSDITSDYIDSYVDGALQSAGISKDEISGDMFEGAEDEIAEAIPEEITQLLEQYGISVEEILDNISAEDTVDEVSDKIKYNIGQEIVLPVLEIIAFLIVYIICSVVFSIIINVISSMFRLPVIKGINKSLGAALGTLKGIAVIGVVCVFAVLAASFFTGNELADAVSEAILTNTVNEVALELIY